MEDLQKGIQQLVDLTKQDESVNPNNLQLIKMPELALIMSKYFVSLSKLCLTHYHSYAKVNKKPQKEKTQAGNSRQNDLLSVPPKKPLTAYILYFQDRVPFFQQKYPKYTISDLTRLIAKEWKEISEESKKSYIERASLDRKRYQNEKKGFKQKKGLKKVDQEGSSKHADESEENSESDNKVKHGSEDIDEEQVEDGI